MPLPDVCPPIVAPLGDVTTQRLALRRPTPDDVDPLAGVFAVPEVWAFPYGRGFDRDETAGFIARQEAHWQTFGFGLWIARTLADDRIVGFAGLAVPTFAPALLPAVEVGWRFDPAVWGRGLATEAGTAALDEAFATLGLERVVSVIEPANRASAAVAQRLGLTIENTVELPGDGRRGPCVADIWSIGAGTWLDRRR